MTVWCHRLLVDCTPLLRDTCIQARRKGTILNAQHSHTSHFQQGSYFHRQLTSALDAVEDRADLKIVVAPSAAAAASIRTAIARTNQGMVNLEALTPDGLAFHILKAMEPLRSDRRVGPVVLQCLMAAALEERSEHPTAGLFARSVPALTQAIGEDRLAGRDAVWVAEHADGQAQELYAELFGVYEAFLASDDLLDQAMVLREAGRLSTRFKDERHVSLVVVASETLLTPAHASLLTQVAEGTKRQIIGTRSARWPENAASQVLSSWPWNDSEPGTPLNEPGTPLSEPGEPPPEPRTLQAATRREEVMMVLDEIRHQGLPVSDVTLAVTDVGAYRPLILSLARRLGVPVSMGTGNEGYPFRQFVSTLLEWMHSKDESTLLADMLRSGYLTGPEDPFILASTLDAFPVSMAVVDRDGLRAALKAGAKRNWTDHRHIDALLLFLREVRKHRWPAFIEPRDALNRLRMSTEQLWSDREGWASSWDMVSEVFADLRSAPQNRVPSRWLAVRMGELLDRSLASNRDEGTSLYVCPLEDAGYGPRSHTWVLGMDDKAAAQAEQQAPPHFAGLDTGRDMATGILVRQRIMELRRRLGGHLTLCAPSYDVAEGRALFPSSALIEHGRIRKLEPVRREHYLDAADACMSEGLEESFPGVASGLRALSARRSNQWTSWDGVLESRSRGISEDGEAVEIRTSVSRLEMLAACPFKFWLSEILKVPVAPKQNAEWLSASDAGQIIHELFDAHAKDRAADRADTGHEEELKMLAQLRGILERQAVCFGGTRDAAVELKYAELAQAVEQYFQRERELNGIRAPVHAEYAIHESDDPKTQGIRIDLESGHITMSGRIDRIDQTHDGNWVIVDYKTGSWKAFVPARLKALESKLQWALYSLAATRLSGRVIEKAEYVFTSHRGAGWVSAASPPPEDALLALLNVLHRRFQAGAFIQAADRSGVCKWCDYEAVCADLDERKAQLREKFEYGDARMAELFQKWPSKS